MRDRHRSSFEKNLLDRTHHDTHSKGQRSQWSQIFYEFALRNFHTNAKFTSKFPKKLRSLNKTDRVGKIFREIAKVKVSQN